MEGKWKLVLLCFFLTFLEYRQRFVVVDSCERVVAAFIGRPEDPAWETVMTDASRAMEDAAVRCSFTPSQQSHRRGGYPTLAVGVSYGGGQKVSPSSRARSRPP